jgi:uncharacterized protein DUF4337
MAFKDLVEAIDSDKTNRDRLIAVYIGILAVLLAVCGVGGGNAMKDATARNIEASNTWAFFQAKNIRRHDLRLQIGEFEVQLASDPQLPDPARKLIDEKIAKYRKDEARLTSEPETGEASTSCWSKAKRSRRSATAPCSRTRSSTMARRCCRSPSCWLRSPSLPAGRAFWC